MGFELKVESSGQAVIRAVNSERLSEDLMTVLKQCVAKQILDISIDLGKEASSFGDLRASLVKLHQFLQSKNHQLKLVAGELPAEVLSELQSQGIVIIHPKAPETSISTPIAQADSPEVQNVPSQAVKIDGLKNLIKVFDETNKLPPDMAFVGELEQVRLDYNSMREESHQLESELNSFKVHLKTLEKSNISTETAQKELGGIQEASARHLSMLDAISQKKNELTRLKAQVEEEDKKLQDFRKRAEQENRKKEETAKKELDGEKSRFEKLQQEFQKKSDARKAEMKKLTSSEQK